MSSDRSILAQIYFYLTGLTPTDFDSKNTEVRERHEGDTTCEVLGISDVKNNSLATVTQKMVASAVNEASAEREDMSGTHATMNGSDAYLNSTDLTSVDFGPCLKKGAKMLKNIQDKTGAVSPEKDVLTAKEPLATKESAPTVEKAENETDTTPEIDVFSTKKLLATKESAPTVEKAENEIDATPEIDVFSTKELLATKESAPTVEKAQREIDTSAKKLEGSSNSSLHDQQVPTEPSNQRSRTEVGDRQEVSEVVGKCE